MHKVQTAIVDPKKAYHCLMIDWCCCRSSTCTTTTTTSSYHQARRWWFGINNWKLKQLFFASSWWNEDAHGGCGVIISEETISCLSERLTNVKLLRDGGCILLYQVSFTLVVEKWRRIFPLRRVFRTLWYSPSLIYQTESSSGSLPYLGRWTLTSFGEKYSKHV